MYNHLRFSSLILSIFLLFSISIPCNGQIQPDSLLVKAEQLARQLLFRNYDTTYIKTFPKELALRIVAHNKYNFFRLTDNNLKSSLRYRPDRQINLGFGVSYKWFSFDLSFNLATVGPNQLENSQFFDFQGTVFSSKHFLGVTYQYYLGYLLAGGSTNSQEISEEDKIREDIRTLHFGLNYLYAFNYGKFSLKAPFVLNQVQRKSAGSIVAGVGFSISILDADSTMIPKEVVGAFDEKLLLTDLNTIDLAINVGYVYSFVWKEKVFLTLGLIPGINFISGDYQNEGRQIMGPHFFPKFRTMNALGYNGQRFFTAFQYSTDTDYVRIGKKLRVDLGRGKLKFLVGYRFGRKNKN